MPSIAEVFVTVLPSEPVDTTSFYKNVLRPALAAVGLPASRPATTAPDGARVPAVRGVRLHDLRHTFATMQLSAGVHFMQVSKWLGHSSYVLTLTTYADYIREDELAAPKVGRAVVAQTTLWTCRHTRPIAPRWSRPRIRTQNPFRHVRFLVMQRYAFDVRRLPPIERLLIPQTTGQR